MTAAKGQQQLQLTYSVGDWVWVKAHGNNLRQMLARIESATPIAGDGGEVHFVRCYYSPNKRAARAGWAAQGEHRKVIAALNPGEVANLRRQGIIPPAGSEVLP